MELENSFEVPAPAQRVWEFLLDLERVTPCIPGAELEELVDQRTWKGTVTVKLGAVRLAYAATVLIEQRDDAERRVVLKASGREKRGKGMANATINSRVEPAADENTRVIMATDLTLSGAVAQYGRGMIADVSKRLTDQFASCLKAQLSAQPAAETPGAEAVEALAAKAKPIGGLRLGLWALIGAIGRALRRMFGRLFGRRRR